MRVVRHVHGTDGLEPSTGKPQHPAVIPDPQSRKRVPVSREQLIRTKKVHNAPKIIVFRK